MPRSHLYTVIRDYKIFIKGKVPITGRANSLILLRVYNYLFPKISFDKDRRIHTLIIIKKGIIESKYPPSKAMLVDEKSCFISF